MLATACGGEGVPKVKNPSASVRLYGFQPDLHTPGFFRDMARLQAETATAPEILARELGARIEAPGELPPLSEKAAHTLTALLALGYRGATLAHEQRAQVEIGLYVLDLLLGLDPARQAWNAHHDSDWQATTTMPGAAAVAQATQHVVALAAGSTLILCQSQAVTQSNFDPGPAETVWVEGFCTDDEYLDGYCAPDRYIEGSCSETWIPEACEGGEYRDRGYYEQVCDDEDDCYTVWRQVWVYEEGTCAGGYNETECANGRWERGVCYDGTFEPGRCVEGHFEHRYPGGTWVFGSAATAPDACAPVRPGQFAMAVVGMALLQELFIDDLEPKWRAALERIVSEGRFDAVNEPTFDAMMQILRASADTESVAL